MRDNVVYYPMFVWVVLAVGGISSSSVSSLQQKYNMASTKPDFGTWYPANMLLKHQIYCMFSPANHGATTKTSRILRAEVLVKQLLL